MSILLKGAMWDPVAIKVITKNDVITKDETKRNTSLSNICHLIKTFDNANPNARLITNKTIGMFCVLKVDKLPPVIPIKIPTNAIIRAPICLLVNLSRKKIGSSKSINSGLSLNNTIVSEALMNFSA